jgi:hypothetical protein
MHKFPITQHPSLLLYHRRLFTRLDLQSVIAHWNELACRQFVQGKGEGDPLLLGERILERFAIEPLQLHEVELKECIQSGDNAPAFLFAVRFSGEAFLWDCSPSPIKDKLPPGSTFTEWHLPPGETLLRPYGEIFRDELFMLATDPETSSDAIFEIFDLIALQREVLANSAATLALQLHHLVSMDGSIH